MKCLLVVLSALALASSQAILPAFHHSWPLTYSAGALVASPWTHHAGWVAPVAPIVAPLVQHWSPHTNSFLNLYTGNLHTFAKEDEKKEEKVEEKVEEKKE